MKVRFKYEKNDLVKYVGHLDVMAMFDRVFRRSNIEIEFSHGFTKRSQIIFALPSSVGVISLCEYFEVEIPNIFKQDLTSIVDKLNENLPLGFKIVEAIESESIASIMSRVISAKYEFEILATNEEIQKIQKLFSKEKIYVQRVAKNDVTYDMNIRPYILDMNVEKIEDGKIKIYANIKSGSKENLKPDYVIQAIEKANIQINDYQIIKTNVLLDN